MAKRFIEPNWKLLRLLPEVLQRAWFYIWDKADESGVYSYDELYMQIDLSLNKTLDFSQLVRLPECTSISGNRILIKNFLQVNNNGLLQDEYNPHKPIFRAIKKNGVEFFSDLDIKIQTGKGDNKKIQALKYFFKLENKNFKLVDVDEDEDEDEDEGKGGAGGKNPNDLIPKMAAEFKRFNTDYPDDNEKDYPALLKIAAFIGKKIEKPFIVNEDFETAMMPYWTQLCEKIPKDKFYRDKSLTTIERNIQSIILTIQDGNSNNNKSNSSITADGLNKAHAKHFG